MNKTLAAAAISGIVVVTIGVVAFRPQSTSGGASVTNPTAFDLPALTGNHRVRLAAYRGTPVVVTLFASWCSECRAELPAFAHTAHDLKGRVQFIGVNSLETGDGAAMARRYHLADNGFVLARDVHSGALHGALKAPGMPVTVFYDANGQIVSRDIASVTEATLRAQLHALYGT